MESPRPVLKIIVLSIFILLLSGFVAYRSGAFDNYLYAAAPGVEGTFHISGVNLADTSKRPDTTIPPRTMISSSKSMILPGSRVLSAKDQQKSVLTLDTAGFLKLYGDLRKIKTEDSLKQEKNKTRFSSSKSMEVIKPADVQILYSEPVLINGAYRILSIQQVDSLLKEMDKKYPVVAIPDSTKKTIMYSSKSGPILSPKLIRERKKALRKYEKEQKKSQ